MRTKSSLVLVAALASHGVSTDERLKRLEALDLTMVRRKLMEAEPEGKGWTAEQALEAEKWYKRYLASIIKYPDATQHVPNGPIDFFWHQHILDTRRYGDDCKYIFGHFLHHYPYFGLNGDAAERDTSFDDTNAIYREMFGEDCTQMQTFNLKKAQSCAAPCQSEACGQGCSKCTVDKQKHVGTEAGAGCNSSGSGTGCGQGCSRGGEPVKTTVSADCAASCIEAESPQKVHSGQMNNCCSGCNCAEEGLPRDKNLLRDFGRPIIPVY